MGADLELFDLTVPHINPAKDTLRRWISNLPAKPVSITFKLPTRDGKREPPRTRTPLFNVTILEQPSDDARVLDRWSVAAEGIEHARYLGAKFFRRRFPDGPQRVWVRAEVENGEAAPP